MKLFEKLFPSDNTRNVRKLMVIADKIEALADKYSAMSDEELKSQTDILKQRLAEGETLNDLLPDAYAVMREASTRVLHQRHYYVQLLGGIALHQGRIAELKTGEGKTLMETLPAYLNALAGNGVHIVTVNEYLAKRDSEWMGKIFGFLGMTVGLTISTVDEKVKMDAYKCDITYGTHSEFGFDYLRDNMKRRKSYKVNQKGYNFAIVDEVDSVLIDEARTPLIISGGKGFKNSDDYVKADRFARTLNKETDLDIDEERKTCRLTEDGVARAERYFRLKNYSDPENMELVHFIDNAIQAHYMMTLDKNYIVDNGEVLIVDEFTGRTLTGRRFADGLHQAIEAKEGVKINDENLTVATITYQNFFRLYKKLSGMTGTAKTEETEFNKTYKLDVVAIPTNKPIQRIDYPDMIFRNKKSKLNAVVEHIIEKHATGQPILVGTTTVEQSEEISAMLKHRGVRHNVLNAKNHERESEIVAQAGKLGAVTIATNMAGRGTDILLGGNPEFLAKIQMKQEGVDEYYIMQSALYTPSDDPKINEARARYHELYDKYKVECDKEKEEVKNVGGLCIIGTERHESRRIDNQLRGRAGRQGDVGESTFYISLEDDLIRIFGAEKISRMRMLNVFAENEAMTQNRFVSGMVEWCQKKVEGMAFQSRQYTLGYDDVLNEQRKVIYGERDKLLDEVEFHDQIIDMVKEHVEATVRGCISDSKNYYEWDLDELNRELETNYIFPKDTNFVTSELVEECDVSDVCQKVIDKALEDLEQKKKDINKAMFDDILAKLPMGAKVEDMVNPDFFGAFERSILLRDVDDAWVEHIDAMTVLKKEIFTRTNPLDCYKKEGYEMFEDMIRRIRTITAKKVLSLQQGRVDVRPIDPVKIISPSPTDKSMRTIKNTDRKIGRNDPCPCGSGKKYKNCCGQDK